jgi:hypothetical protein
MSMIRTCFRPAGAALALSLALSTGAFAQQQLPPGSQVLPIPQATPTHLACAKDLVLKSGMGRTFLSIIPDMMRQVNQTVTLTRPELIPDMKTVLDSLQPEFMKYADDMTESAARVYTALLNEAECKDALAFFASAVGEKYVNAQPTMYANIAPALENWNKVVSARMLNRVREEMKKKGHDI